MWYLGDDGSTSRILGAIQKVGEPWERLGVVIDAGFSGETDSYGVESPCVVETPVGYLMAYGGFDGRSRGFTWPAPRWAALDPAWNHHSEGA